MTRVFQTILLSASAVACVAAPAAAAPVGPTDKNASAKVTVLRPLQLKFGQDLDLGTVALGAGTFTTTIGIDKTGVWTCDATKVTCTGTHQVAKYNVVGTNNRVVNVFSSNVSLSNGSSNLTLAVDAPTSVSLGASGNAGVDFAIGGSITLSNSTVDGIYSGQFNVTVDYQ